MFIFLFLFWLCCGDTLGKNYQKQLWQAQQQPQVSLDSTCFWCVSRFSFSSFILLFLWLQPIVNVVEWEDTNSDFFFDNWIFWHSRLGGLNGWSAIGLTLRSSVFCGDFWRHAAAAVVYMFGFIEAGQTWIHESVRCARRGSWIFNCLLNWCWAAGWMGVCCFCFCLLTRWHEFLMRIILIPWIGTCEMEMLIYESEWKQKQTTITTTMRRMIFFIYLFIFQLNLCEIFKFV